ncbi:hypothetical protein [Methylobacterium sp. Leaf456]|uniref:hypothetical protein n=1 Tax=Methylobacterium sp. Leaf456 TaxID=1736382 RepID=UPI0009EC3778|nr:hypothetical protein [Methylobacterium sp. Leaf456]
MSMMETHPTRSGPMNPSGAPAASFEAWQALIAPGDVFRHPREVLVHPHLSREEKRAILASWASDACALEDAPALRCLTGSKSEPVSVDTVFAALAELDRKPIALPVKRVPPRRRARGLSNLRRYLRSRRRYDDDDPPPCPAAVRPRPRPPSGIDALAIAMPA